MPATTPTSGATGPRGSRAPAAWSATAPVAPFREPPLGLRLRRRVGHTVLRGLLAAESARGDPVAAICFTDEGRRDPYPHVERLRAAGRLVPSSVMGWVTVDHALATEVLRDHERFGSARVEEEDPSRLTRALGYLLAETAVGGQGKRPAPGSYAAALPPDPVGVDGIIGMDPPRHTRIRRLAATAFTRRAVDRLRPLVEQLADELLDEAARRQARGEGVDLVRDLATPLPVAVVSTILGIPREDHARALAWGDDVALTLDLMTPEQQRRFDRARVELAEYFAALFDRRRRHPGNQLVDALIAARDDETATPGGAGLSDDELVAFAIGLLMAGFETTVMLIGNTVNALLLHPGQRRLLAADHSLVAATIEESLRWDPPFLGQLRYVRADTELAGVPLGRGDRVMALHVGTNRDPAVFADPDAFDITRDGADRHISFGSGIHYCLGAQLARLEGQVALRRLLERFPDLRASGPGRRAVRLALRGMGAIPVDLGREAAA